MDVFLVTFSAIVLLTIISFRKSIYIYSIKILFGEYSYRYIMKFKKYTKRKPHPYCFKDEFYYHILAIQKAINFKIQYESIKPFTLYDLDFGKSFKPTLVEKGAPDCFTISDDKNFPLKVAGYKSRMFHSNEKTLHYYCKDKYFMGEYVFSSLGPDTPELIVESLKNEFNPNIELAKNFTIKDKVGNYLFFTDTGFFLSIKFFNINNPSIKAILDYTRNSEEGKTDVISVLGSLNC